MSGLVVDPSGGASSRVAAGWCWFHGPRAVSMGGRTYAGVVTGASDGRGRQAVVVLDHGDGSTRTIELSREHGLDDHNVPAVAVLGPDRLIAGFTGHQTSTVVELVTIDLASGDGGGQAVLGRPIRIDLGRPCTYVMLAVDADGRTVTVLTRSLGLNPTLVRVDLETGTWTAPQVALPWKIGHDSPHYLGPGGGRPYVVYAADGERIHFALTPDHPPAYRNGIYAGYLAGDDVHDANGRRVATVGDRSWDITRKLTRVVPDGEIDGAWVQDLVLIGGQPRIAFSTVTDGRVGYWLAVRGRRGFAVQRVAEGGAALLGSEPQYAGGMSLSRTDPAVFAISADVDPLTGMPQDQRGLFLGCLTQDGPAHFTRIAVGDAPAGPIRPVFSEPIDAGGHALLWLEGTYPDYRSYDLWLQSRVFTPGTSCLPGAGAHVDLTYPLDEEGAIPAEARGALLSRLHGVERYLEYGSGGSTLGAVAAGVQDIVTIDSDLHTVRAVQQWCDLEARGRSRPGGPAVDARWADIGTTREWGHPLVRIKGAGRRYVEAIDDRFAQGWRPQVVLIDGRYRVACFLYTALTAIESVVILWDDYAPRAMYHVVEELAGQPELTGRLATFVVDPLVDPHDRERWRQMYEQSLSRPA